MKTHYINSLLLLLLLLLQDDNEENIRCREQWNSLRHLMSAVRPFQSTADKNTCRLHQHVFTTNINNYQQISTAGQSNNAKVVLLAGKSVS